MESMATLVAGAFGSGSPLVIGMVETISCVVVGMLVLRIELQRRAATGPTLSTREGSGYAQSCKRMLQHRAPEAAGVIACLALAAALRARGDPSSGPDDYAWAQIKAQWPVLMTADTVLSLQTMLRLLVLLSCVLRAAGGVPVPLGDETAMLWLGAGLARVALLVRTDVYMLDGPLGGNLPAACEVAVLPLLFVLSRGSFSKAPLTSALTCAAVAVLARRNHLNIAGSPMSDGLFIAAHGLDLLAAFAYLLRTLLMDVGSNGCRGNVSIGFAHLLMPVQQCLATYYFVQAFAADPALVGSGRPFAVLQIGGIIQVGFYLGAAAVYVADCLDHREVVSNPARVSRSVML